MQAAAIHHGHEACGVLGGQLDVGLVAVPCALGVVPPDPVRAVLWDSTAVQCSLPWSAAAGISLAPAPSGLATISLQWPSSCCCTASPTRASCTPFPSCSTNTPVPRPSRCLCTVRRRRGLACWRASVVSSVVVDLSGRHRYHRVFHERLRIELPVRICANHCARDLGLRLLAVSQLRPGQGHDGCEHKGFVLPVRWSRCVAHAVLLACLHACMLVCLHACR